MLPTNIILVNIILFISMINIKEVLKYDCSNDSFLLTNMNTNYDKSIYLICPFRDNLRHGRVSHW